MFEGIQPFFCICCWCFCWCFCWFCR